MKCKSLILKIYKKAKADSCYPVIPAYGLPNPTAEGLPECGGTLKAYVAVSGGGCCCSYGGDAEIDLTLECSKCKHAYANEKLHSSLTGYQIEQLFEGMLGDLLKS